MKKQNNLNFIIYHTLLSTLGLFLVCNNYLIKINPKSSFIWIIVLGLLSIILLLFLPNKIDNKKHQNIIKHLLSLYYILSSSLYLSLATYIIIYYFFSNMNYFILPLLLLLMILLFSFFKKVILYNVGLLILIITFLLNFVFIFNTSLGDINLIHNIINSKFSIINFVKLFSMLFLFIDPIAFYYNNIIDNKTNIKKSIIISNTFATIISSFTILINYLFYSYQYLDTINYPAFSSIFLFLGPEFIDHFSIMILINILIFIFLKCSMNINSISSKKFINIFSCLIIYLVIIISFKYYTNYIELTYHFGLILSILILLIYLFTIFGKKEKEYVKDKT